MSKAFSLYNFEEVRSSSKVAVKVISSLQQGFSLVIEFFFFLTVNFWSLEAHRGLRLLISKAFRFFCVFMIWILTDSKKCGKVIYQNGPISDFLLCLLELTYTNNLLCTSELMQFNQQDKFWTWIKCKSPAEKIQCWREIQDIETKYALIYIFRYIQIYM